LFYIGDDTALSGKRSWKCLEFIHDSFYNLHAEAKIRTVEKSLTITNFSWLLDGFKQSFKVQYDPQA